MNRLTHLACALVVLVGCSSGSSDAELLASARAQLDKQEYAAAVILLKNALSQNPDSPQARLLLGRALLRGGEASNALVELLRAQDLQVPEAQVVPDIARALLATGDASKVIAQFASLSLPDPEAMADLQTSLATALAANNNKQAARGALAAALQAKAGYSPAMVMSARLSAADGDVDGALRQIDQVLAADAGNESAGLLKGQLLLQAKNDAAGALASYMKVREANPRSVPAHSAVVKLLLEQGKGAEGRQAFERLKQLSPNHPETLFLQAGLAFDDQDYKATRDITARLLAGSPNNERVLVLAGAAEYRMRNFTLAQAHLGKALKVAPEAAPTRQLLAQTFMRDGQPDKALEVLQPVVDSPTADAAILALAGEAYLQAGDARRSEAVFQRALKLAPGDPRLRTAAAMAQIGRGDGSAAMAQLQAIAREDGGASASLALVSAKMRQQDAKGALQAIDELQKKMPTRALPFDLRARVLIEQGDAAGAAASFKQALEKEPTYFAAIVGLAALEYTAGKGDLARQRFEALIKADPKNFRARLALAQLDTQLNAPDAVVAAQLREAVKVAPVQPETHLALIDHLILSRDHAAALQAAQEAAAALPSDLRVMGALGHAQQLAGENSRAVVTFKQAAALQPKNAPPLVRLAEAQVANKDPEAAMQTLRQALVAQPEHLPAERSLALLLADKRPQEGLAIARAIQKRMPKDPAGFTLEAEVEERARNWAAAATAYQAALQRRAATELAIRLHGALSAAGKGAEAQRVAADWLKARPKDAAFVFYLGDQALAAKNWSKAEEHYRGVLALQPRNAVAMNNVAWLLASQRKPGAVAMAEQANALVPERPALLDTLAFAQEAEGKIEQAVLTQQRAVALDPKAPELRLRLAQLLAKQGNKAEALKLLDGLQQLGSSFQGQADVAALAKTLR